MVVTGEQIRENRRQLGERVDRVIDPIFLDTRICPYLRLNGDSDWRTRVLQLDGTGAATIEIGHGGESVFAKLYPNADGPAIFDKLRALREAGFGAGERYQVVEPLAFVPELNMLLARGAEGSAASDAIGTDETALRTGVEEAGRWLAALHSSPVRIGQPRSLMSSGELASFARRLAKVVAREPAYLAQGLSLVQTLEEMAEDVVEGLLVQSHGQYRPIHVFLGGTVTTVIDLDRSRPCDPSRDVAEFIHRLRETFFTMDGSSARADEPTQAFLNAYRAAVVDPSYLANLRFHRTRYIAHSINHKVKDRVKEGAPYDIAGDPRLAFYHTEFEEAVAGRFAE